MMVKIKDAEHSQTVAEMRQRIAELEIEVRHPHNNKCDLHTGRERLIRSHSSARFYFELSGNSN